MARALLGLITLLTPACATLPEPVARASEHAFARAEETALGRIAAPALRAHDGQSGFVILDTGREAFLQRAALIEAAERSIDAQYYIWNSDPSGRYLARRLLNAADRGVRVRLLLDDMNISGRDAVIAALDRHPNIDIRIFNPFAARSGPGKWLGFIGSFQRLNRRMHNKSFVADAAFGIVGGRNIGDEYFDLHPQMNFRDRDVMAAGPVVHAISDSFDAYWNNRWSYPIALLASAAAVDAASAALDEMRNKEESEVPDHRPARSAVEGIDYMRRTLAHADWAPAELIYDPPAEDVHARADQPKATAQALRTRLMQANSEILIESAYLILGDPQLETLAQTRSRGVRIAALTNSLASNDLTTNHAGYARQRAAMLAHGLTLHELRPDAAACVEWIKKDDFCDAGAVSLHTKSAVFDRKTLYIGSFNLNLRSIFLNGETILIIESAPLAQQIARDIEHAMAPENSWRVTRDEDGDVIWTSDTGEHVAQEPETGWWRRFKSGFLTLFPLERYL